MLQSLKSHWRPILVFLAAWLVYFQVRSHAFVVFDDPLYVGGNAFVVEGLSWKNIIWAFNNYDAANWHPLTWLSHMLDVEMWGLDAGWHILENVLLHSLIALLLYVFCGKLGLRPMLALLVALAFAVHPQNVEAVAWMSQRKSLLNALFMLASLNAYVEYTRRGGFRYYGFALIAFIVSLMAKSMTVTMPVLMLLLDVTVLGRQEYGRRDGERLFGWIVRQAKRAGMLVVEKAPFLMLSAWISYVTVLAQDSVGAVVSVDNLPLWVREANAILSCFAYIKNAIIPGNLSVFYARSIVYYRREIALCSAALLLLLLASILTFRKRPAIALGYAWFLVTLMPVIGLVQVGSQSRADRYFYVPGIGLLIMFAGIYSLISLPNRRLQRILAVGVAGWVAILGVQAFGQVKLWRSGTLLFTESLQNGGKFSGTYVNLIATYLGEGRIKEALACCESALKDYPGDLGVLNNYAGCKLASGDLDGAMELVNELLMPRWTDPRTHLISAAVHSRKGQLKEAEQSLKICRALLPKEKQWQLSLENIKKQINDSRFRVEMLQEGMPATSAAAAASTGGTKENGSKIGSQAAPNQS